MDGISSGQSYSQTLEEIGKVFKALRGAADIAEPNHVVKSLPRLEVDKNQLQVRFSGKVYSITANQAIGLTALIEAGGDWVSWSGLGITKPSAVKSGLPKPIQALIETCAGKGYRLKQI